MDMKKVEEILSSIKNPQTGETLSSENREISGVMSGENLVITYSRDGITPDSKRKIEDVLVNELSTIHDEEKILVKTISTNLSKDVTGKKEETKLSNSKPANLQTGHGPAGAQKKRVPGVKNVIAISSGKGGVGKSTVTANLAATLTQLGYEVGIIDADIYGPSIPMLMGKRDAKPASNDDKKILPIEAHGMKFISFGLFIPESDAVIWRGPMLGGVLNQFLFDVDWGGLDYLLIDLPPGTGDMQLSMIQLTEVDSAVVISTPQDVALLDSKKGLQMLSKVNIPVLGMIENMSYFSPDDMPGKKYHIFGESGVRKAAQALDVPVLTEIPIEIALREGSDSGVPYMTNKGYEGRPVWNAYMQLAKSIIGEDHTAPEKSKGLLGKIGGLFGAS